MNVLTVTEDIHDDDDPSQVQRICLNDELVTKLGRDDKILNQRLNC